MAGTTGESPTLSSAEDRGTDAPRGGALPRKAQGDRRRGSNSTRGHRGSHPKLVPARRRCRHAGDSLLQQAPAGRSIAGTSCAAADASAVPIILYNVPSRTAVDLLPGTVARLARHPRIVAIKEATASLSRARELLSVCPPEFVLLSGDDATAIDLMGVGARGVISVTANVAPRRMHEACRAALAGDMAEARAIDADLQPLHKDLFVEANPDTRQVGGWREWGSLGTQSACRWSNWQRRTTNPCCGRCGPPELPLRTKLHESGSSLSVDGCRRFDERLSFIQQAEPGLSHRPGIPARIVGAALEGPCGARFAQHGRRVGNPGRDRCTAAAGSSRHLLDIPPRYMPAPSNKAASG